MKTAEDAKDAEEKGLAAKFAKKGRFDSSQRTRSNTATLTYSASSAVFSSLPHLASFICRPDHRRIILAAKSALEFCHVRERADHAILGDRVGIGFHHQTLLLRPNFVAAELSPGDEELLLRCEAVEVGRT